MNPIALGIIGVGVPLSLVGFLLTRAYVKADLPRTRRVSYRADLFNSIGDKELRAASDAAVIASGIVAGTVIHS